MAVGGVGRERGKPSVAGLSLLEVMVSMLLVSVAAVSLLHLLVMALQVQNESLGRFQRSREHWNRLQAEEAQEPLAGGEIRLLDWERGWIVWDGAIPAPEGRRGFWSRREGDGR